MSAPGDACQRFEPSTQVHSRNLCCRCGLSEQDHKSAPGLVTELVEALKAERLCVKQGATRETAKTLGLLDGFLAHGSLWLRKQVSARTAAALARATPEAVQMADAAPEMYEALTALDEAAGSHNISTHDGWNVTAPRLEIPPAVRAQVDDARRRAEGKP